MLDCRIKIIKMSESPARLASMAANKFVRMPLIIQCACIVESFFSTSIPRTVRVSIHIKCRIGVDRNRLQQDTEDQPIPKVTTTSTSWSFKIDVNEHKMKRRSALTLCLLPFFGTGGFPACIASDLDADPGVMRQEYNRYHENKKGRFQPDPNFLTTSILGMPNHMTILMAGPSPSFSVSNRLGYPAPAPPMPNLISAFSIN